MTISGTLIGVGGTWAHFADGDGLAGEGFEGEGFAAETYAKVPVSRGAR